MIDGGEQSGMKREYFTIEEAAEAMRSSTRHAKRLLATVDRSAVLFAAASSAGRPRAYYHFTAHPRLFAALNGRLPDGTDPVDLAKHTDRAPKAKRQAESIHPADLEIARLRARAVEEYIARRYLMPERNAAIETAVDWRRARTAEVQIDEREGHRLIDRSQTISVGGFSERTLRNWHAAYLAHKKQVECLAPGRRGASGRDRQAIPEALLDLIHALAVATPRGDITKGIEAARMQWRGDWPDVSDATLRRRIRERDPARFCDTLGKRGVGTFRLRHSPDIDTNYSQMPFNGEWQLDDITEDFYGHASDPAKLVRPFAYAVIRVATRQWICAVACETPITQDQVRSLLGMAMANSSGGIPDQIRFERGTIACDDYLEDLLTDLGVRVGRTSMDGGRVHPGALPDRAKGHFQGKGIVEANIRNHHNRLWFMAGQTGPDERHTSQARLETLKAEATARARNGEFLVLPTPAEWQAKILAALNAHNQRPHSGLPTIVDPESGTQRHMTPNEKAALLGSEGLRVLDEAVLPLFFEKGYQVEVGRNGIKLHGQWYGRFDEELQARQGEKVMAYACPELPEACYVVELGRCVGRYEAVRWGAHTPADIETKRSIERAKRNQYEQLIANAMANEHTITPEAVMFTADPTPNRLRNISAPDAIAARATRLAGAVRGEKAKAERQDARFGEGGGRAARSPRKREGLLASAGRLGAQVEALSTAVQSGDQNPFEGI